MILRSIFLCSIFIGIISCSGSRIAEDKQPSFVSAQREVVIGNKHDTPNQQIKGGRYMADPSINDYLSKVGRNLAQYSELKSSPYKFEVINSSVPNVWALSDGIIGVSRGLLLMLNDEAQLAFILAHEIAHLTERHGFSQTPQQTQELQSDHYGIKHLSLAGYEPYAAVELQELFHRIATGQRAHSLGEFFSSHPPSTERIAANKKWAKDLPGSIRNREEHHQATARLRKSKSAYIYFEEARKLVPQLKYIKALSMVNKALGYEPRENLFWELQGHILNLQGNNQQSLNSYETAISLYPEYYSPWLAKGILLKKDGAMKQARSDITKSYQLFQTQIAAFHLGELALHFNENQLAIEYFTHVARYADGGPLAKKADAYLAALPR